MDGWMRERMVGAVIYDAIDVVDDIDIHGRGRCDGATS